MLKCFIPCREKGGGGGGGGGGVEEEGIERREGGGGRGEGGGVCNYRNLHQITIHKTTT